MAYSLGRDTLYATKLSQNKMQNTIGKRIVDISGILEWYEAQEGEVQNILGKTGMGKTYEATRRAIGYLYSGYTVYTTWRLNIPDYYDEREHFWPSLRKLIFFQSTFIKINLRENWKYIDLDNFLDEEGIMDTEALAKYLATRTDCIFMLDEGQDVFDSHQKSGKIARQSITRSRHRHMTLIVISQRAQAVDVTARGNVTNFYKCEKIQFPFLKPLFRVYRTDEIDEASSYPLWERHDSTGRTTWKAQLWHSAFARKWIYDSYDSWYMRKSMVRSQDIKIEAFTLSFKERIISLLRAFKPKKRDIHISTELSTISRETVNPPENGVELSHDVSGNERMARKARKTRSAKKKRTLLLGKPQQSAPQQTDGVANVEYVRT